MSASGGAQGACGCPVVFGAHKSERETWRFQGRETLWDHYTFLVWTLEANPAGKNQIGQRFVRFVQ